MHSGILFQDDGGIEYFNTIVVQPHLKLVTNQGRGFHVRCRYQTRDKVVTNDNTHVAMLQSLPLQVRMRSLPLESTLSPPTDLTSNVLYFPLGQYSSRIQ